MNWVTGDWSRVTGQVVVLVGGALVSVVPVLPVVLVVVGGLLDVDVGGWPGRGGWRLVVVATPEPVTLGATAVEVAEPPLLTTTGGFAAPAAPRGSGGTGVTV